MLPDVEYATPCTYRCSPQLDHSIPRRPVCVRKSCGPSVTHPGIFRPKVASPMLFISFDQGASLARKRVAGSAVRRVRSLDNGMYAMVPSMIWVHSWTKTMYVVPSS